MMALESRACKVTTAPPWVENPYRLLSLGEIVERILPGYLVETGRWFCLLNTSLITGAFPENWRESSEANLRGLRQHCDSLGLRLSVMSIDRISEAVADSSCTAAEIKKHLEELHGRFHDELASTLFMFVAPERIRYYVTRNLFGTEVASRFPEAVVDIEEAGKCLALGRATAAVFHLMRVAEASLYIVAKDLKVKITNPNWDAVLREVDGALAVLRNPGIPLSSRTKARRKAKVEFYSEAAAHLRNIKDAWRNRTSHLGATYTVEKAEEIFRHVEALMRRLATKPGASS